MRHAGAHMKSLSYLGVLAKRPLATQLSLSTIEVWGVVGTAHRQTSAEGSLLLRRSVRCIPVRNLNIYEIDQFGFGVEDFNGSDG